MFSLSFDYAIFVLITSVIFSCSEARCFSEMKSCYGEKKDVCSIEASSLNLTFHGCNGQNDIAPFINCSYKCQNLQSCVGFNFVTESDIITCQLYEFVAKEFVERDDCSFFGNREFYPDCADYNFIENYNGPAQITFNEGSFDVIIENDWILVQNHNGSFDFNQTWTAYMYGFGDGMSYWLGLSYMSTLSLSSKYHLKIVYTCENGTSRYALYDSFTLGKDYHEYQINIGGFLEGEKDILMKPQNNLRMENMKFSTFDSDNDKFSDKNCANQTGSGWWFNSCETCNPNGKPGVTFYCAGCFLSSTKILIKNALP